MKPTDIWLFPGPVRLASYRRQLDDMETVRLAEQVNLAARLLAEYGDRTALFDEVTPLAKQELVALATQQQFYTVLLADDSPQRTREPGRRTARLATSG